jgi:hypothetical protein
MKTHSLKDDLRILELGREYFPKFSKDTTDDEAKNIIKKLKDTVIERRTVLVMKYQENMDVNYDKIKEINEAADRILEL